eukprot:2532079-Alexandrium_andersonii.AAC.1
MRLSWDIWRSAERRGARSRAAPREAVLGHIAVAQRGAVNVRVSSALHGVAPRLDAGVLHEE